MTTLLVRLRLDAAFHVGERGIGLEGAGSVIHADTLFGAICHAWRLLYGVSALESWLERFPRMLKQADNEYALSGGEKAAPLLLTSMFPYAGRKDMEPIYFLPIPSGTQPKDKDDADYKKFKRISYLSTMVFSKLANRELDIANTINIQGSLLHEDELPRLPESTNVATKVGGVQRSLPPWLTDERDQPNRLLHYEDTLPHVSLDRLTSASNLYHVGETAYAPGCGLYFLANVADSDVDRFKLAIQIAGENGIGGRRSTGRGQFTPIIEDIGKSDAAAELIKLVAEHTRSSSNWLNLGLLAPAGADELGKLLTDEPSYRLLQRRGWVDSAEARMRGRRGRSVTMFAPGATFAYKPSGALVEVTPDQVTPGQDGGHSVYRYGCAFVGG